MNMMYLTPLHWLTIGFFFVLFVVLSLLSARAKSASVIMGGIFASFLVTVFGGVLGTVILEKSTKKGIMANLQERRILFNETMFISGNIRNIGRYPFNYCTINIKLVNNDRKQTGKGTFFSSAGLSIFGKKDKAPVKPNTVEREKVFKFKPALAPGRQKPFSLVLKYPGYFRGAMIIKKIYCH